MINRSIITWICTNQITSWLMCSCNTFGARTNHGQTQTHKTHHDLDLGEKHHLPFYSILYASPWGLHPNSFCPRTPKLGVLKFLKLGLPRLWRPITSYENFRLRWGLKENYSPCREFSNSMWHTACMQVNQGDSQILVVGSQIGNLTLDLSFGHNLCFKYPNGSCEPILNIYVPTDF